MSAERETHDRRRARPAKKQRSSDVALERRLRPIVRRLLEEMLEDRLDYVASEASLADGLPVPAREVWKKLGI